MSSEPQHLKQARHNEAVARLLTVSRWAADWEVITLFYAAVHLVEAKAAVSDVHSAGHSARVRFVHACYRAASMDFGHLMLKSRRARYECAQMAPADVAEARAWLANIRTILGNHPVI